MDTRVDVAGVERKSGGGRRGKESNEDSANSEPLFIYQLNAIAPMGRRAGTSRDVTQHPNFFPDSNRPQRTDPARLDHNYARQCRRSYSPLKPGCNGAMAAGRKKNGTRGNIGRRLESRRERGLNHAWTSVALTARPIELVAQIFGVHRQGHGMIVHLEFVAAGRRAKERVGVAEGGVVFMYTCPPT
jgi:hypothetical protein